MWEKRRFYRLFPSIFHSSPMGKNYIDAAMGPIQQISNIMEVQENFTLRYAYKDEWKIQ